MKGSLQDTIDELNKAFESFKTSNDERIAQIEARGSADAVTVAATNAANAAVGELTRQVGEMKAQIRLVETANARIAPAGGSEAREKEVTNATLFLSHVRGEPVDNPSNEDIQEYQNYRKAFGSYLRRGDSISSEHKAALQTGSAPDGGLFVTPDVGGRIVELLYQTSAVRQIASAQPIGTDTLEGVNDLDEADSGWVGEQGTRSETTTPKTGQWKIPVHEQYANPKTTQKQLDDTNFNVEAWLAKKVAAKLSRRENTAFVTGNGISKPRGFMTYAAGTPSKTDWQKVQQVVSGASGAFAAVNPADKLIDLVTALKPEYRQGAVFVMNTTTAGEVRKIKDGEGRYVFIPDFAQGGNGKILGHAIAELADMADLGSSSLSLAFGNFQEAYQIVDHTVGIRVLRDPFTAKPYVQFYTTKRVGGDVVNFEALKIMKFSA